MGDAVAVLHVVDCLNIGGTERQLYELLRHTDRSRFRPLLASFNARGELLPHLRELGIEPLELPLGGRLFHPATPLQIARLSLFCRREGAKIIHAHDYYSNIIAVAAAPLSGARVIASRRDLANSLSPAKREALKWVLRGADRVLANAAAVANRTTRDEGVPPHKVVVVPNGIDAERFDRLASVEPWPPLPPAGGRPRIITVANMSSADKGHEDLLAAAALLRERGRELQWLLVSDGTLRAGYEARVRQLGLDGVVVFLGRRQDVPSLLARADLLLHPSWAEGFPNAVLEAMCAALPVVATRVGGCPELMGDHAGRLVEPRRPRELALAVDELLQLPDRGRALGRRGRRRVEQCFSLDRMTASVEALYSELLASGRAAAAA
jgi:glycosyltransferase involved in cell wall biosynthesis